MAYKAIEIAKYILYQANEYGDLVSNLKLQKLLYYAQGWYLALNNGNKLFEDECEAWQHGAVIRSVYNAYKKYGRRPIDEAVSADEIKLDKAVRNHLDDLIDKYMCLSAFDLVNMMHCEEPWKNAYHTSRLACSSPDCSQGSIISTGSMYDYYSKKVNGKKKEKE